MFCPFLLPFDGFLYKFGMADSMDSCTRLGTVVLSLLSVLCLFLWGTVVLSILGASDSTDFCVHRRTLTGSLEHIMII